MRPISDSFIKLLEAIGAVSISERATAEKAHFQENATLPTERWCDNDAVVREDSLEDDDAFESGLDNESSILTAIWKVGKWVCDTSLAYFLQLRKIVRSVRSSPQRHQAWLSEVNLSLRSTEEALHGADEAFESTKPEVGLMLILDVKTRWSSTHQMLRKSLFRNWISLY